MAQVKASRTLVKSTPELWAECSDAAALARHLGAFGEIRITKLEPETAVAWEGDDVRGTVTLEPSGWGTKVILTATPANGDGGAPAPEAAPAPEVTPAPEPEPQAPVEAPVEVREEPDPEPAPRRPGFFARLFGRRRPPEPAAETPVAAEPEVVAEPEAYEPEPGELEPTAPEVSAAPEAVAAGPGEALAGALESLGMAHRRPFSHG